MQKLQARQEQENQALAVLETLQKTLDENPKVQFKNAGKVTQEKIMSLSGLSLYITKDVTGFTLNIRYWKDNDYVRIGLSENKWEIDHALLLKDLEENIARTKNNLADIQKTFDDSEELIERMESLKIECTNLDALPYFTREFLKDTLHDIPGHSDFLKYN